MQRCWARAISLDVHLAKMIPHRIAESVKFAEKLQVGLWPICSLTVAKAALVDTQPLPRGFLLRGWPIVYDVAMVLPTVEQLRIELEALAARRRQQIEESEEMVRSGKSRLAEIERHLVRLANQPDSSSGRPSG